MYLWVIEESTGTSRWCIDQYIVGNVCRWRVENKKTGWNIPHSGLEGFETIEEALRAMLNYRMCTVKGEDYIE
jgi:hypothetical protein